MVAKPLHSPPSKTVPKKGVRVFFVRFGIHAVLLQLIQAVFVKKDWDGNPIHSKSEK